MKRDVMDGRLPRRPLRTTLAVLAALCAGLLTLSTHAPAPGSFTAARPAERPTFHERVFSHAKAPMTPDSAVLSADAARALPPSQRAALPLTEFS